MKGSKLVLHVIAAAAAFVCCIALRTEAEVNDAVSARPVISLVEERHDFGKVPEGTVVEHVFTVRNLGEAELEIQRIHPACGCTAAVIDNSRISPGGEAKIRAKFDTRGFGGRKEKTIRIYSNDPHRSSLILAFSGTVIQDVRAEPARVYFGKVFRGETPSREISVIADPDYPFEVVDVISRSEHLELTPVGEEGNRKKRVYSVRLKESVPLGVFREEILANTTSATHPVVNIPVFARVLGEIELEPVSLSFGLLDVDEFARNPELGRRSVRVINHAKRPLHILKVSSDHPNLEAAVSPLEDGLRYEIIVSIDRGFAGTLKAKVRIETDCAESEQREIILPVYGLVVRKDE